jgi:predicted transcriptional regulator
MTEHGRRPPGALSAQVLGVLRAADRAMTPTEVQRALADAEDPHPLAYTTVVTVLSRLHAQGLADRFRTGRAYAYRAVADHSQLAARRMRRVLDAENDRDSVLASFVSDLSSRDEEVLRRLLDMP